MAVSDRLQEVRMELHQGLKVRQKWQISSKPETRQTNASKPCRNQMSNVWNKCINGQEKLEKDLTDTLAGLPWDSFKQLESGNRGLGEYQTVARDVGALNKVLSGTKRGFWANCNWAGIEDIMTPAQYERICNGWKF